MMAIQADYYHALGAFTASFAQLEVALRRAVVDDPTLPWAGVRRRLAVQPRGIGNAAVLRALARSDVHPMPRPLLADLFRLNALRVRVVHHAYRPTGGELARGRTIIAVARRWLAVHARRRAAWSAMTARRSPGGADDRSASRAS